MLAEPDLKFLRQAIDMARLAREHGNHPFGAVLVDAQGQVLLVAENTLVTNRDWTAHAETNLMRLAAKQYDAIFLNTCTLYSSTEPCPMCAGAIYLGGIGRLVYALSEEGLYHLSGSGPAKPTLRMACRDVFSHGDRPTEILGPAIEDEAGRVHEGFW